ncbi:MAG: hypothetical protein ACLP50_14455 [Solirubrobacteraceae bacterium]
MGLPGRCCFAVAAALLVLATVTAALAVAGPLRWSAPLTLDAQPPFGSFTAIDSVSCPSVSLCVAVDHGGSVLVSRSPTGGPGRWTVLRDVDPAIDLVGVSCPTVRLCVAVDAAGAVAISTDPAAGASAWRVHRRVDPVSSMRAAACPSTHLCVAIDGRGGVLRSTDPAGTAGSWRRLQIVPGREPLASLSCPTATRCVAVGPAGISSSTDAATRWLTRPYPDRLIARGGGYAGAGISCPSAGADPDRRLTRHREPVVLARAVPRRRRCRRVRGRRDPRLDRPDRIGERLAGRGPGRRS